MSFVKIFRALPAACATEALLPVTDSPEVRMGSAAVSHRSWYGGPGVQCLCVEVPC
ncbi:MAG: hypothetical protein MRJ92_07590 [Nitrospira sp.]|nr:hypothetical protein [Nitrospira sp.]